jgi:hypothetical protein
VWEEGPLCGAPVVQEVVRTPVVLIARYGQPDSRCAWFRLRPVVQGVVLCAAWFRPNARYAGRDTGRVWSAHATHNPKQGDRSAEHAHAVDAAARRRDRGFFEMEHRPEVRTDLWVAAQLMGNPLGRAEHLACQSTMRNGGILRSAPSPHL